MNDLISRKAAIDSVCKYCEYYYNETLIQTIKDLPSVQPEKRTEERAETHACDLIDRQAAIDKFIDGLEDIFADLRERHVDDSVCGLCEYDGAYIGQSGNWCNECPGFEKDDCFKLSDKTREEWTEEIIKALPSAQPEEVTPHRNYQYLSDYWCECGWHLGKMGDVNYCPNCGKKVKWDE